MFNFIIILPSCGMIQNFYHPGGRKARGNKKGPYERALTADASEKSD